MGGGVGGGWSIVFNGYTIRFGVEDGGTCILSTPPRSLIGVSAIGRAYSTSCFSGLVPSAPTQTMLRMTSGSPMPNDHRMPKYSAM